MHTTDFSFVDHGTIVLLMPRTPEATAHLRSDAFDGAQVWGSAIVVEPRYVDTLAAALAADGFTAEVL
jgi:hypothetical protein